MSPAAKNPACAEAALPHHAVPGVHRHAEDDVLQVEILSVGDFVNELLLIMAGHACLVGPGKLDAGEDLLLVGDDNKSVHDGPRCAICEAGGKCTAS